MTDGEEIPRYAEMNRLDGQVHVVIGTGVGGIGFHAAHALAAAGAKVFCVDVDPAAARETARQVGGEFGCCDVTQAGEVERILGEAERRLGRIDGVTNVVGVAVFKPFAESSDDEWDWQQEIVLRHAFRTLRAAIPHLEKAGGGSLSFVSSVAGLNGAPSNGIYGLFKAAMMSMVRSAAIELGPAGIRVNAVAPGATLTPRLMATQSPQMRDAVIRATPLRKAAQPSDIAAALLFLASPLAGHVTGQTIVVDGGCGLMNWRELSGAGIPPGTEPAGTPQ